MSIHGGSQFDSSRSRPEAAPGAQLSPEDALVLDALMEHRFDPAALESMSAAQRRRVDAMMGLLGALDDYPVEDSDETLVHVTLARIDRFERERVERMSLDAARDAARTARPRWFRLPDFISVAAVMLIGTSIVWPLVNQLRQQSIDASCGDNLRRVAQGFTQYASDFNGAMPASPVATAGFDGWASARNYNNLSPLISRGYCDEGHLSCPGHHHPTGPSYSYQLQVPGQRQIWGTGQIRIIMADRNPLIDAFWANESAPTLSLSLNHAQRGQNAIQGDGSVGWLTIPRVGNDNIWLPDGIVLLQRGDCPQRVDDVFLTH